MDPIQPINPSAQAGSSMMPQSGQKNSHKGVAFLFAVVIVVLLGGIGYWMITTQSQRLVDDVPAGAITPQNQEANDTTTAIESDLDAAILDDAAVDQELKTIDEGVNQL